MRVKNGDGKGTSFANPVWKPVVLIEMKKLAEDLTKKLGLNVTKTRIRR
jgi:hypothetical protein